MYWTLGIIYIALSVAFIADVLRNPTLTGTGKALWIVALLLLPVVTWLIYGTIRLRQSRGL
jgi:cytochrome c-type biogenesis protein CcmH/NrfF